MQSTTSRYRPASVARRTTGSQLVDSCSSHSFASSWELNGLSCGTPVTLARNNFEASGCFDQLVQLCLDLLRGHPGDDRRKLLAEVGPGTRASLRNTSCAVGLSLRSDSSKAGLSRRSPAASESSRRCSSRSCPAR
ncbi:hypothetical protein [Lentzea sp. E54]|uniref:hypothetical protein n=1 Tax=Lentzea xerophila TaxID=3435883 RepID=UPI003DA5190A